MTISFDNDSEFTPLDDGPQQATVFDATLYREEGRKPNINVQFKVVGGSYDNRRVFQRYYFTPKSLWRLKQLMVSAGQMDSEFSGSFDEETIPDLLRGEAVTINVITTEYNGKSRNEVDSVSAPQAEEAWAGQF